jgi:hypothetical protein
MISVLFGFIYCFHLKWLLSVSYRMQISRSFLHFFFRHLYRRRCRRRRRQNHHQNLTEYQVVIFYDSESN